LLTAEPCLGFHCKVLSHFLLAVSEPSPRITSQGSVFSQTEKRPHSLPTCQPQSPWLAHSSPDSTPSPPMSRSQKPDNYGVLTLTENIFSINL
ncbi:hypothetical protein XENORESO_002346, partial [Xenotaenia resolanae]